MQGGKKETEDTRAKRTHIPITARLHNALDVPLSCASNMSHVQLSGGRQAIGEGCESVIRYTDDTVVLRVREGYVHLCGKQLQMESLISDRITVYGIIHTVTIKKEAEAENV